jgi:hypothetical protein
MHNMPAVIEGKTLDIRKQTRKNKVYSRKINSALVVKTPTGNVHIVWNLCTFFRQWLLVQTITNSVR